MLLSYGALALFANWPSWPGDPSRYRPGDLTGGVWDFAYAAQIILHGHSPFFTNYINYPLGENLAESTPPLLLGLLSLPITVLAGPIASLNFWLWFAFPISAASVFFVLRRFGFSRWAAYVGGLVYGFSPYMNGQGSNHLNLVFMPLPPLIFLAAHRLFVAERTQPLLAGSALGALIACQFYINPEVAVTTLVLLPIGLLILALARPRLALARVRRAGKGLVLGVFIAIAAVAYPVWYSQTGPQHFTGSLGSGLSADLLGTVVPTSIERFAPASIAHFGDRLVQGDTPENGSYLSIPILLLCGFVLIRYWRNRWVRFAAAMAFITVLLSLGGHLAVGGHVMNLLLPGRLIWDTPVLQGLAEVRFTVYIFFFVAVLLAVGIDKCIARWQKAPRHRPILQVAAFAVVLLAGLVMLVPNWPYGVGPASVPSFFTTAAVRSIPQGSTVLVSPYPSVAEVAPMLWQAESAFRFRLLGGYVLIPGADGTVSIYPDELTPLDVYEFLYYEATTGSLPTGAPNMPKLARDCRLFLRRNHVDVVISSGDVSNLPALQDLFTRALGPPNSAGGGLSIWYNVQKRVG
jgi:hypothetical protein